MSEQYLFRREGKQSFRRQDEIDAARRALRVLRDSFHLEPEAEFEKALFDSQVQRRMGNFIAKAARPNEPFLRLVRSRDS